MRIPRTMTAAAAGIATAVALFVVPSAATAADSAKTLPLVDAPKMSTLSADSAGVKTALALAKDYVTASEKAWNARITADQNKAIAAQKKIELKNAELAYDAAQGKAERLAKIADEKHDESAAWARELLRNPTMNYSPSLQALLAGPDGARDIATNIQTMTSIKDRKDGAAAAALESKREADEAEARAAELSKKAERLAGESQERMNESEKSQAHMEDLHRESRKKFSAASTALNNAEIEAGVESTTPASQRVLMVASIQNWNQYVKELRTQDPVLPAQDQIVVNEKEDATATLASNEKGDKGSRGKARQAAQSDVVASQPSLAHTTENKPQVGAAETKKGTVVLSKAAIARSTTALNALDTPFSKMECQDLASRAFGFKQAKSLEELYVSGYQNPSVADTLPGDVVFFKGPYGLSQAGISIGQGLVVISSATAGSVIVAPIDSTAVMSVRPGIDFKKKDLKPAPKPSAKHGNVEWKCGGIATSGLSSSSAEGMDAWVLPFGDRDYTLAVEYGEEYAPGKDGKAQGMAFVRDKVDVVQSAVSGGVSVKGSKKKGYTVTVKHNDSITVRYSGLTDVSVMDGAYVNAGDPLGSSGKFGLMKGQKKPGVFVEALVGEAHVDPNHMFFPPKVSDSSGSTTFDGYGGYSNGKIPEAELCGIGGNHMLRCDAAEAYKAMDAAYKEEFGKPISITDSYRSFEAQVRVKASKGYLAATPGTSNHGWGLAVDLGGGINSFGTDTHRWMMENAPKFGWDNPGWARENGRKPEAWHWEYVVGMG